MRFLRLIIYFSVSSFAFALAACFCVGINIQKTFCKINEVNSWHLIRFSYRQLFNLKSLWSLLVEFHSIPPRKPAFIVLRVSYFLTRFQLKRFGYSTPLFCTVPYP